MTTGRINQVRTIGGARARAWPRPPGCGPQRAPPPGPASCQAPLASSAGTRPQPSPGGFGRPGASPHASEERASGRAGAELPMRGGPRGRSLASPRPAPPSASARSRRLQTPGRVSPRLGGARLGPGRGPSCPCGVAPAGARSPAPGLRRPRLAGPRPRLLLVHTFGAPAPPCVKPWRAPRYCQAAYCDSDEGVRLAARFPWDGRPRGKTPPGYAAATARLTPRARLDATAHRRQDTDAPRPAAGQGLAP